MNSKIYDIIIVGGGIIGGSTAYNLLNFDNKLKVAVVEMDPTYSLSSTTLSVSNARIQFSLTENIKISQYALDALERFEDEMAVDDNRPAILYRREGNLFLVDEKGKNAAKEADAPVMNHANTKTVKSAFFKGLTLQRSLQWTIEHA